MSNTETTAQRAVRQINESVERMRADMAVQGPKITRAFAEAIEAARRKRVVGGE